MKKIRQYLVVIVLAAVAIITVANPRDVYAKWETSDNAEIEPIVFGKITTQTDKVRVYVYENRTLKITNGTKTIYEKTYQNEGKKTIKLPPQKANTILSFTLTTKTGISSTVKKKVKDDGVISNKKVNANLKKPVVSGKITDKSTTVKVYAKKGDTLYIQNGAKVLKKVKYQNSGYKNISIEKQKAETKLTFYVANKTKRSEYVTKEVKDVTAPAKPKVGYVFEDISSWINVEGEIGCDVYVRKNGSQKTGKWKYMGTITGMNPVFPLDHLANITSADKGDTFSIRLVDDAGNKSKIAITEPLKEDWHPIY